MIPLKILIVDDDELQCWFWQKTLENRYGTKVIIKTFSDAREAFSCLSEDNSLILLDWHMPHLDAKAFLEKAREKGISPGRFVIFSGSDRTSIEEAFGASGCLAVVEKGRVEEEEGLLRLLDELLTSLLPRETDRSQSTRQTF